MTRIEKMPPDIWVTHLEEWRTEAEKTLRLLKKEQYRKSKEVIPSEVKIYGSVSHGRTQFYHLQKINGKYIRKYIPQKNIKTVQEQLQQEYLQGLITQFEKSINVIDSFLNNYKNSRVWDYFSSLPLPKKRILTPILLSNELFAEKWESEEYVHMDFYSNTPEHYTIKNERVRSKSEVIITDTLTQMHIPYKYEMELTLGEFKIHPDFVCLNVRTRQEFIWEHLGLMDNQDYALKALRKLHSYMDNKYFLGTEVIISWETSEIPFTKLDARKLIEKYLL